MKNKYFILPIIAMGAFVMFSVQGIDNSVLEKYNPNIAHKSSNGTQINKTGAPGEDNCTFCHGGSVMAGDNQNILKVMDNGSEITSYIPGTTYKVSLSLATGNVKEGFASTVLLNSDNTAAGSFPGSDLVGAQVNSFGGRFYASHTSSSNLEGNIAWEWDWTAPSSDLGPVTFYVSSNKANGNGSTSGDQVFLSQHVLGSTLSIGENQIAEINFSSGYNSIKNELTISYSSLKNEQGFINIVDLSGKSVFTNYIGDSKIGVNKKTIKLGSEISQGTYVVQFFLGNKPVTSKVFIK